MPRNRKRVNPTPYVVFVVAFVEVTIIPTLSINLSKGYPLELPLPKGSVKSSEFNGEDAGKRVRELSPMTILSGMFELGGALDLSIMVPLGENEKCIYGIKYSKSAP